MVAALDGVAWVRHALLTFSGTWAAPGTGYCSWVAQAANPALVYEVPVISPWTFGFVGGPASSPSYRQSVHIAVEWAVAWILAHPYQTFMLGGYSQGGEAASRVYAELLPGGRLAHRMADYVAGYTFGNPCRQEGHTIVGGSDPGGHGISTFNLTGMDDRWADHANPGDLYTTCPDGASGAVETDVYELAIDLQLNDPMTFLTAFIQHALKVLNDSGVLSPTTLAGGLPGLFAMAPTLLIGMLGGLLGGKGSAGAVVSKDPSLQATIQAAITGLTFMFKGTGPHITYDTTFALPGVTHLQHAIGHVNFFAERTTPRTAA